MTIEMVLLIPASVGFFIALCFTALAYRVPKPILNGVPALCPIGGNSCRSAVDAAEARILRLPNSLIGLIFYAVIIVSTIPTTPLYRFPVHALALGCACLSVIVSAYLAYTLLFRLRIRCTACFVSHVCNVAILLSLLVSQKSV